MEITAQQIARSSSPWPLLKGICLGTVMGLAACFPIATEPTGDLAELPQVVTTSTMITDWAAEVGGDGIALVGILEAGADPHIYEPVPQDSVVLEEADLIFYNGYDLEPNLIRLISATGIAARAVALGETVEPLDFNEGEQIVPDPHVWGNVANVIEMVETIRDELVQLAPEQANEFTENAADFTEELTRLNRWIETQIATIPVSQRQLITTHDAFQYYATAYGLEVAGTLIGISTEEQPSAQTVQRLADRVQVLGVPTIFAETTLNSQLIEAVAAEAGVQLAPTELYSDSLGAPGSDGASYVEMMVSNTQVIVENLGGEYSPFPSENSSKSRGD